MIVISNPTKSTKSFKNEFLYLFLYSYCMLARFISQNKTHLSREHRPRKVGYFLGNKFSSQHSCINLYSIKLSTEYVVFWYFSNTNKAETTRMFIFLGYFLFSIIRIILSLIISVNLIKSKIQSFVWLHCMLTVWLFYADDMKNSRGFQRGEIWYIFPGRVDGIFALSRDSVTNQVTRYRELL